MKFLEKNGLKTAQTRFRDIFQSNIHRNYADDLLAWLERETDFFEAPASTRNHGAHPGGLLVHSLNVYRRLRAIVCVETYGTPPPPTCWRGTWRKRWRSWACCMTCAR